MYNNYIWNCYKSAADDGIINPFSPLTTKSNLNELFLTALIVLDLCDELRLCGKVISHHFFFFKSQVMRF